MRTVLFALVAGLFGCSDSASSETQVHCCEDTDPYVVPSDSQPRVGVIKYYIEPTQAAISGSVRSVGLIWTQITRGDTTFERVTDATAADFSINCNYHTGDPTYSSTLDTVITREEHVYSILIEDCNDIDELRTDLFHLLGHEAGIPDINTPGKFHYVMRREFIGRPGGLPTSVEFNGLQAFFDSRRGRSRAN